MELVLHSLLIPNRSSHAWFSEQWLVLWAPKITFYCNMSYVIIFLMKFFLCHSLPLLFIIIPLPHSSWWPNIFTCLLFFFFFICMRVCFFFLFCLYECLFWIHGFTLSYILYLWYYFYYSLFYVPSWWTDVWCSGHVIRVIWNRVIRWCEPVCHIFLNTVRRVWHLLVVVRPTQCPASRVVLGPGTRL